MATSTELDLTPPSPVFDETRFVLWVIENLTRLQTITAPLDAGQGISDTFTTVDGKTVTVVDGVITDIV